MTNAPVSLRDLRKRIYIKAKAEPQKRFWGLYVHVCKLETLQEAYRMAKENDGAPGSDGVTFAAIEESGVERFLDEIRNELLEFRYRPLAVRKKEIPKDGGKKVRVLSIPAIRDRVVQGALKLILEPVFEADFQPGSYGYRPKRTAQAAVLRVEYAVDTRNAGAIQRLSPAASPAAESCGSAIGHITLGAKTTGERSAGDPHAPFDVAGAGDQFTVRLVRHSQRKRGATDRPDLRSHGASPRPYQNGSCIGTLVAI
jgi:hypothetical protein